MSKSRNTIELKEKNYFHGKKNNNENIIPLSITYDRRLPNISIIVNRNSNILQINTDFHRVFKDTDSIQR